MSGRTALRGATRGLAVSTLLFGFHVGHAHAQALDATRPVPRPAAAPPPSRPSVQGARPARVQAETQLPSDAAQPELSVSATPFADDFMAPTRIGRDAWGPLIASAAEDNGLPVDFLLRLVQQESGFNPASVSRAGALGIAQFMPATAIDVGLRDPFNPAEAIPAAARYLRALRTRFGNLGLAAAAYNAGSARVTAWLAGRGRLTPETIRYVVAVTGRSLDDWGAGGAMRPALPSLDRAAAASGSVSGAGTSTAELCQMLSTAARPCVVQQHY